MPDSECNREILSVYIDGELYSEELHLTETHLQECFQCRQALEQLRQLSINIQGVPRPPVSPLLTQQILSRVGVNVDNGAGASLFESWGALSLFFVLAITLFGGNSISWLYALMKQIMADLDLILKLVQQVPLAPLNMGIGMC